MDSRIIPLHGTFQLNTRLFLNCLEDVSDELSRTRPNTDTNNLAFVTLHLHDARHYLARYLGLEESDPFAPITSRAQSIEDIEVYPSVNEIRTAWMEISIPLEQRFTQLAAEVLDQPSPEDAPDFPDQEKTILGGLAFMLQHESFHIGQMALLRKFYGLPAMSWHP